MTTRLLTLLLALVLVAPAATAEAKSHAKKPTKAQCRKHPKKKGCAKKKAKAKAKPAPKGKAAAPAAPARPADGPAPSAADAPLAPGSARFWDGATVSRGDVRDESLCDVAGPCFAWPLNVAAGGKRLRVAVDVPMRDDTFTLTVLDPSGAEAGSASTSNTFDAEVFVDDPAAGAWMVKVVPSAATDAAFRMRAKLETAPAAGPAGKAMLLPDLKAVPPLELSFVAPLNPANGLYPPDTVNPPADVAGYHPFSCTVDEMGPVELQGGAARRCLRFTSGPINAGAGPYEMHWSYTGDLSSGAIESPIAHGPMTQVIKLADGTSVTRPAGTYSYHVIHGHFHDDGVLDMELYKVGGDATLTKVGVGVKSGFCPANQLLGDWRSFDNTAPDEEIGSGDTGTGNCQNPVDGVLGLSPGWGDVYRWQRPGMYVEFGTQPDGIYVVRITIDKGNDVLESDETNNSAYALVKVVGDRAIPLERGQGLSPFDPAKIVFTGSGPASRD